MAEGAYSKVVALLATGLVGLGVLASCGGDSAVDAEAEATAARVLACIEERGGEGWPLSPNLPDDAPTELVTVYAIGPERGHIGAILFLEPAAGEQLAAEIDELGEYRSVAVNEGQDVLIYDPGLGLADKMAIYDCAEA
ncbi:MAG: hypothetical protein R2725_10750 [Solirubrobacterales bacterium]